MDRACNTAYENFKGKLVNQAELGITFAETSQSIAMFGRAADTILRSMRAVRRGQFKSAATILKLHVAPVGVSRKKNWADNWLEYHFGWTPFLQDAWDAMEVLNDPVKTFGMARGRGMEFLRSVSSINTGAVTRKEVNVMRYDAEQGGRIRCITDRGLFTLNQWGLLNPATVAWEVIPFSFVVDWFANVGDVLQSYSDFAGMQLENTYLTTTYRNSASGSCHLNPGYTPTPGWSTLYYSGSGVSCARYLHLWKPVLSLKTLRLPSASRIATAASLVVQQAALKSDYGWTPDPDFSTSPGSGARKRYRS
jgi:hypothetical protein